MSSAGSRSPRVRPLYPDHEPDSPSLLDITPDGQFVYESRQERDAKLGERFRQIFVERGVDFFDLDPDSRYKLEPNDMSKDAAKAGQGVDASADEPEKTSTDGDEREKLMTPEKLYNMRTEILPRLQYVRDVSLLCYCRRGLSLWQRCLG